MIVNEQRNTENQGFMAGRVEMSTDPRKGKIIMSLRYMKVTSTQLRQNIYRFLDEVLNTGVPLEVERKGKVLKIIAETPQNKLKNIQVIKGLITCNPDELEHIDWSEEWQNDLS